MNDHFRRARSRVAALAALVLSVSACAGATVGSGVGERMLDEPPYYAGRLLPVAERAIGVMPIGYQRGAAQPAIFEPQGDAGSALAALLDEMNAYLVDSLDVGVVLVQSSSATGTAPDVMFRCATDSFDECAYPEEGGDPQMRLAIARPSQQWSQALATSLDQAGAAHAVMVTLEFSDYWTYQRNLRGSKEVRLGTGHTVDVPWLTSLETPVSVLQLTGALLDREGKAVRIGAEGLIARRTPFLLSALGAQELIDDDDIDALRSERRTDLDGDPLAWKVALRSLVEGLIGR